MKSLSFNQLFAILFMLFAALLAASALSAWTGPTATAPAGNVAAPINVGTTDQVKNAGLSVNSLAVFGSQYVQTALGVGRTSPVTALDVNGSVRIANGGETCESVTAGTIRYNTTSSRLEYCNGTSWAPVGGVVKFGGTYLLRDLSGSNTGNPANGSCSSVNIYTGSCSCPSGYSQRPISYTPYNGTSGELWAYSCESN